MADFCIDHCSIVLLFWFYCIFKILLCINNSYLIIFNQVFKLFNSHINNTKIIPAIKSNCTHLISNGFLLTGWCITSFLDKQF